MKKLGNTAAAFTLALMSASVYVRAEVRPSELNFPEPPPRYCGPTYSICPGGQPPNLNIFRYLMIKKKSTGHPNSILQDCSYYG
jgi:hypothetical protein